MIVMKITIDNNLFMTIESKPDNLDLVDDLFTYHDMSACWVYGKFRRENMKTVKYLTKKKKNPTMAILPIGFKQQLESWLKAKKAKYKIYDSRSLHNIEIDDEDIANILYNENNDIVLYDYQIDAVKAMLDSPNGMIKAATGAGKTEVMMSLIKILKVKTLVLFKKVDLAHQTMKRMKKANIDAGIVQGKNIDEDHDVVMATVQSGHKLKSTDYRMVIVDEAHNARSKSYQDLLRSNIFTYRYGFSATPWVKDKYKNSLVTAWLGGTIYEIEPEILIKMGKLADPTVYITEIDKVVIEKNGKDYPKHINDYQWQAAEKNGIMNNVYRNNKIKEIVEQLDGQVLVLVKYIDHGKALQDLLSGSVFIYGDTDVKDRQLVMEKFEKGEDFVLIASTILDEGVDLKNINHIVMAGGGISYIKIMQRIGRGMRILKDKNGNVIKNKVNIYDFLDMTNHILERHSNNRIRIAQKAKYKVKYI